MCVKAIIKEIVMKTLPLTLAALVLLAACQQPASDESAATPLATVDAAASYNAAQKAYAAANDKMHSGMGNINADADVAFMQGMIPHHMGRLIWRRLRLSMARTPKFVRLRKRSSPRKKPR